MVKSRTPRTLIVGTRASKLALVQTEIVRRSLLAASPELDIRVERITTRGDEVQDRPLSEIGGNGLFVSVIEAALREGKIDIAVHSAKDLSTTLPPDLALVAFPRRADPRDVLISREGATLAGLPAGAVVGTSSPRRTCLLRAARPDLELRDIRGNVDTRLRKLRDGDYDAIVLAAAGLERLGLLENVTEWLDPEAFVPAVAQGALAVEARSQDAYVTELLTALDDPPTSIAVRAERAFLARLSGGCSLPVGAYATLAGDRLRIVGMVGSVEGAVIRGEQVGSATAPERAGVELAERLLARGGAALVEASGGVAT